MSKTTKDEKENAEIKVNLIPERFGFHLCLDYLLENDLSIEDYVVLKLIEFRNIQDNKKYEALLKNVTASSLEALVKKGLLQLKDPSGSYRIPNLMVTRQYRQLIYGDYGGLFRELWCLWPSSGRGRTGLKGSTESRLQVFYGVILLVEEGQLKEGYEATHEEFKKLLRKTKISEDSPSTTSKVFHERILKAAYSYLKVHEQTDYQYIKTLKYFLENRLYYPYFEEENRHSKASEITFMNPDDQDY